MVVGNPKLPSVVTEQWGWKDIPQAEQEATMVAELLQTQALLGNSASKEQVLNQMQEAECIHFATHVSWKLSSLVLSPIEVSFEIDSLVFLHCRVFFQVLEQSTPKRLYMTDAIEEDEHTDVSLTTELPPFSEFLLSAADILSLKLSARLVVVGYSLNVVAIGNDFIRV